MTNGDRIRQMSNEELAENINKYIGCCSLCAYDETDKCEGQECLEGIKAYLESEEE